ncbi:hypothetical protein TARUN_1346 [Trichoderma arundinaceum]|uniref:Uncharacterized protein n=1 Tax=Trichoderma arundinaceum TaxID=490622 RepID=A0A395NXN9_TRIAR|nr:hypothetical protein TARUN_1346 [Trichoderma arundinaceum]
MTGLVSAPRYSAEDFDTASIRSAAPSYAYTAAATASNATTTAATTGMSRGNASEASSSLSGRQTIGLPPLPPLAAPRALSTHNFRIPTWSTSNAPAARHYRKVAERRMIDGRFQAVAGVIGVRDPPINGQNDDGETPVLRPLEDPYLVGEQAAAEARQQRIAREAGEDMLREEDKQWDWLLAQMKTWEERDRNWTRFRQEAAQTRRKTLFRRIGGRLL